MNVSTSIIRGFVMSLFGMTMTGACVSTPRIDVGMLYLGELGESEAPRNAVAAPEMIFEFTIKHSPIIKTHLVDIRMNTCDGDTVSLSSFLYYQRAGKSYYRSKLEKAIPNKPCSTKFILTLETRGVGNERPEVIVRDIPVEIFPR